MRVRPCVAVREYFLATHAVATRTPRSARFYWWERMITRTKRQETVLPKKQCLLFFDAKAAVQAGIPPAIVIALAKLFQFGKIVPELKFESIPSFLLFTA